MKKLLLTLLLIVSSVTNANDDENYKCVYDFSKPKCEAKREFNRRTYSGLAEYKYTGTCEFSYMLVTESGKTKKRYETLSSNVFDEVNGFIGITTLGISVLSQSIKYKSQAKKKTLEKIKIYKNFVLDLAHICEGKELDSGKKD